MVDAVAALKAVGAAMLAASILCAHFGPRPRRRFGRGWFRAFLIAGVAGELLALFAWLSEWLTLCAVTSAVSVLALSGAVWVMRAGGDDDGPDEPPLPDPGSPGDRDDEPGGPSIDWDAFDRERSGWRPRSPA